MSAKPQFSPEAQARRARGAQRAESFKAHALAVLDVGKGFTVDEGGSRALDGGTELAVAAASRAVLAGRRLRISEKREVRQQVLAEQAGRQPAGHTQRRRPSPREWLEAMTPAQRRNIEGTDYFKQQSTEVQARILRLRDEVDEIDVEAAERAEYELASQREEAWLAESWESGGDYWEGADDAFEERLANRLELDSAAASADWEDEFGDSDEEEVEDE
jgi:hypothetical protein